MPKITNFNELLVDGKKYKIASCLPVWEVSNILTQRLTLPWKEKDGKCNYSKSTIFTTRSKKGKLSFFISNYSENYSSEPLDFSQGIEEIGSIHPMSVCFHLLYSIYAVEAKIAGNNEFIFSSKQIEQLFELDKVKWKTKSEKIYFIKWL